MPDRTAYFTNWQVRAALEGRLSVLFVPMNPQPPEGVTYRRRRAVAGNDELTMILAIS